jgi:hypothetical protein
MTVMTVMTISHKLKRKEKNTYAKWHMGAVKRQVDPAGFEPETLALKKHALPTLLQNFWYTIWAVFCLFILTIISFTISCFEPYRRGKILKLFHELFHAK